MQPSARATPFPKNRKIGKSLKPFERWLNYWRDISNPVFNSCETFI
ncbi:hypothetical protein D1AOALGA4SA_11539 [Olavius algarvensis Delta 1 endosymbiont]|nr:hypothetical protein D1AOALGA4SA_11539 [Olavius algarvensis Delta 1 endosymbiont]